MAVLFDRLHNQFQELVVYNPKLNKLAIQWLTTLNTLVRFTQMEPRLKEQEELTFQAHHALRQCI